MDRVARGIGIILVIFGHTLDWGETNNSLESEVREAIYSFHMPLFFMIGGLTFQPSTNLMQQINLIKKSAKQLLGTTILIYLIRRINYIFIHYPDINYFKMILRSVATLIFASGVHVSIFGKHIDALGLMWFLVALFLIRLMVDLMYYYLDRKLILVITSLSPFCGYICSRLIWLPLSMDVILVALPFFVIGFELRKGEQLDFNTKKLLASIIFWVISYTLIRKMGFGSLNLAAREFSLFPLFYIPAVLGSLSIIYLSMVLSKLRTVELSLSFLGQQTLLLFGVHALDFFWVNMWDSFSNDYIKMIVRLCVNIFIMMLVYLVGKLIKTLRKQ